MDDTVSLFQYCDLRFDDTYICHILTPCFNYSPKFDYFYRFALRALVVRTSRGSVRRQRVYQQNLSAASKRQSECDKGSERREFLSLRRVDSSSSGNHRGINRRDSMVGLDNRFGSEKEVPLSQMQQRLHQTFRHENALSVPVRQGAALSMPVLHEDRQVLVEHVRARAKDAQGQKVADHRYLQTAADSSLLKRSKKLRHVQTYKTVTRICVFSKLKRFLAVMLFFIYSTRVHTYIQSMSNMYIYMNIVFFVAIVFTLQVFKKRINIYIICVIFISVTFLLTQYKIYKSNI